jgi:hypothetical protein
VTAAPERILALAEERAMAKANRDFATADRLRAEIEGAGWRVLDTPDGFTLTEKPLYELSASLAAIGFAPLPSSISVGLIVDGWWSDAQDCLDALIAHSEASIYVLDVTGDDILSRALAAYAAAHADRVRVAHLQDDPGWGPATRRLAELSTAPLHVLIDPSTVLLGPALDPLVEAFADAQVVGAGWKGALVDVADEWRSVVDAGPGEVDVLLGYLMMVRRESLLATEYPSSKARFYRNADLELSLGLRSAGGRLVAMDLPVEQRRHHGYHDSDPQVRERESKRNYDRILNAFRGRTELLSARNPARDLG